jgi:hypothetical protein
MLLPPDEQMEIHQRFKCCTCGGFYPGEHVRDCSRCYPKHTVCLGCSSIGVDAMMRRHLECGHCFPHVLDAEFMNERRRLGYEQGILRDMSDTQTLGNPRGPPKAPLIDTGATQPYRCNPVGPFLIPGPKMHTLQEGYFPDVEHPQRTADSACCSCGQRRHYPHAPLFQCEGWCRPFHWTCRECTYWSNWLFLCTCCYQRQRGRTGDRLHCRYDSQKISDYSPYSRDKDYEDSGTDANPMLLMPMLTTFVGIPINQLGRKRTTVTHPNKLIVKRSPRLIRCCYCTVQTTPNHLCDGCDETDPHYPCVDHATRLGGYRFCAHCTNRAMDVVINSPARFKYKV